jgi:hypothetical protein
MRRMCDAEKNLKLTSDGGDAGYKKGKESNDSVNSEVWRES